MYNLLDCDNEAFLIATTGVCATFVTCVLATPFLKAVRDEDIVMFQ